MEKPKVYGKGYGSARVTGRLRGYGLVKRAKPSQLPGKASITNDARVLYVSMLAIVVTMGTSFYVTAKLFSVQEHGRQQEQLEQAR